MSQGRELLQDGIDAAKDENGFLLGDGKPLPSSVTCSVFSSLKITATAGKCTGLASADCTAVGESQSTFVEAYEDWWIGDDGDLDDVKLCEKETVETAAKAIATAVAKVWASAFVLVECEGQGFACGWAASNGEAFAMAFAEAIAFAAADASLPDVDAFCVADIRAISGALAQAAESARADTCTAGGTSTDFEDNYASAVVDAIAEAFASATASACKLDDEARAKSECFGVADSGVVEVVEGAADTEQLRACEGGAATCCGNPKRFCGCDNCNGPLRRQSEADGMGTQESWKDTTGTICFCT